MNVSLREETKRVVNSLLVPHAKGIFLSDFIREFHSTEGRDIPFRSAYTFI